MTTKDLARLGMAVLVGAGIAFPAGMIVAGRNDGPGAAAPASRRDAGPRRDVFAPSLSDDPWFLERQREGVEALERHCAGTGELCPEARAARSRLAELEAG